MLLLRGYHYCILCGKMQLHQRVFCFLCKVMAINICSINSGSNGNCYYVGNETDAVLIDAGLSCRETEMRMHRAGLEFRKVKAVFITHEHTDHTRGAEVISRKHDLPIYFSRITHQNSWVRIRAEQLKHFAPYEEIRVGSLVVTPFPKNHDASEPHSFIVTGDGITVGVLTDIGSACEHVIANFSRCHAAFLEANYDEVMLRQGSYPEYLKKRIRSSVGHMSNTQALALFTEHRSDFMSHLLLAHLSKENNDPELVKKIFMQHAGNILIDVASRYQEGEVYTIG